jgi:D-amino-acid oxidase
MQPDQPDVLVIGAGVTGLTCAVSLAETGANVRVLAENLPGGTSLAAGALWGPYLVEPKDRVRAWALTSFARFAQLAKDPATGVRMAAGVEASRHAAPPPDFTDMVPDLAIVPAQQLPTGFRTGVRYTAPLIDMPVYLTYLKDRLLGAGGSIRLGRIASLAEAAALAPRVVNATGVGSRTLVPDESVYPIRGQLVITQNPGLTEWFSEDTGESSNLTHWYPHNETLALGGLALAGDWNTMPDPEIAAAILERCAEIEPALRGIQVLEHRAGLRPTRPMIRLDTQQIGDVRIVHCYGHGGAGVTLSWGCADEVRDLVLSA